MSESALIALLGLLGLLLTSVVGFVLGKRAERQKQSLLIRSQMLTPVEEWLEGAERISGILADTLSSVTAGSPMPVGYDFEERKKSYRYMGENTNKVMGILDSKSLRTLRTWRKTKRLGSVILEIDSLLKYAMLPRESEILDRDMQGNLTNEFMLETGAIKLRADMLFQEAYSLISRIRTSLT